MDIEKVIILPNRSGTYKILPINGKQYLLNDGELYEMNVINGNDVKHNGLPVKSYLFESNPGKVLKSATTIITNKCDPTWLLIEYFNKNNLNYKSIEDIKDSCGMEEVPDALLIQSFDKICTSITEGGELFYKYSKDQTLNWINEKILKLQKFILYEPNSIIGNIKKELNDPSKETDHELIELSALEYSIDYISVLKEDIITHFNYDFSKIDKYLDEIKDREAKLAAVESNMNLIVNNNPPKKKPVKKDVKKVKRGALDNFFKKA